MEQVRGSMICGLDLSISAPGVAFNYLPRTLVASKSNGGKRLQHWARSIMDVIDDIHPYVVVLEGYSMHSPVKGLIPLAELGGVIRTVLIQASVPYVEVPPTVLKKFATGKGNATKDDVIDAARAAGATIPKRIHKRSGKTIYDDNAADAFWLWQIGVTHYLPKLTKSKESQIEVLHSVKFPDVPDLSVYRDKGDSEVAW